MVFRGAWHLSESGACHGDHLWICLLYTSTGIFKEQGEQINHISDGMTHAIEERMKSERFRTEPVSYTHLIDRALKDRQSSEADYFPEN